MDDGVAGADGEEGGMLAADKATWHKWLSKRESEASREPSTAATLLCAAKLPQMVSEMLKSPDLPPLLTRKLVGLLAQPSVRRAPNVERTDALYRLLLNSALMNGAPPPEVDPTDEAAAEAAAAAAAERGGAAAEVRPPIIAYIEALPTLSRQAAGGGGGGGGGSVVSEFLNLLRELHGRYGSEADAHALLASLVQPLRAAARGVNLTMAVEEAVDDLLEKLSEPLAADANGGAKRRQRQRRQGGGAAHVCAGAGGAAARARAGGGAAQHQLGREAVGGELGGLRRRRRRGRLLAARREGGRGGGGGPEGGRGEGGGGRRDVHTRRRLAIAPSSSPPTATCRGRRCSCPAGCRAARTTARRTV